MEKVHGTSAHISWNDGKLGFFSGGESHEKFVALFDQEKLRTEFDKRFAGFKVIVYGEAYGGKCQGMKEIYGPELRFIAFDVQIDEHWLSVPKMDKVATDLGLEVIPWNKVSTEITILDHERDRPSEVAIRRGMGNDKLREGVVLRPLEEMITNNDERVICKHKGDKFSERTTPQKIISPDKLVVLEAAEAIAEEWATPMRLRHVIDKLPEPNNFGPQDIPRVIAAMIEDIFREAEGEIIESREARTAIGKRTVQLFKKFLNER